MIVVKVELHSAVTKQVTELARMTIANVGGTDKMGNYEARVLLKPKWKQYVRNASVFGHRRKDLPVWVLVARALFGMGYLPQSHYAPSERCHACGHDLERPYEEKCPYPKCPCREGEPASAS